MQRSVIALLAAVLISASCPSVYGVDGREIVIAERGKKAEYSLVVSESAGASVKYAADALRLDA